MKKTLLGIGLVGISIIGCLENKTPTVSIADGIEAVSDDLRALSHTRYGYFSEELENNPQGFRPYYRKALLSEKFLLYIKDTANFKLNPDTDKCRNYKPKDDPNAKPLEWEIFRFHRLPPPAALTELTKWRNNIQAAEGQMDYLLNGYLRTKEQS